MVDSDIVKRVRQKIMFCTKGIVDVQAAMHEGLIETLSKFPEGIPPEQFIDYFSDQIVLSAQYVPVIDLSMWLEESCDTLGKLNRKRPISASTEDLVKRLNFAHSAGYLFSGFMKAKDMTLHGKLSLAMHGERTAWYAQAIAQDIELSEDEVKKAHLTGKLHDVGKIGVPGLVLTKPSRLEQEEWRYILSHPETGRKILEPFNGELIEVLEGMRSHHENFNGQGYPQGLKGENIPLFGRIVRVADSLDSMTSKRPYEDAKDFKTAAKEIKDNPYGQFDPVIAERIDATEEMFNFFHNPAA